MDNKNWFYKSLETYMFDKREQLLYGLVLLMIVGLCFISYMPGLSGRFLLDDVASLAAMNDRGGVTDWESLLVFVFGSDTGALGRPVSMLSFLIDDQYFPGSVANFRYTNLMIHLLCALFLFVLCSKLLRLSGKTDRQSYQIALWVTLWWSFSPLHVSTTLYVVQRMTQLSTLFILIGLVLFLKGRENLFNKKENGWWYIVAGLYGMGTLAVLSKENGALIFVFAAICELFITSSRKENYARGIKWLVGLPIVAMLIYTGFRIDNILISYTYREFSLWERVLTEGRVLINYFISIIAPLSGKMSLFHDDYIVSRSLFDPWYTAVAFIVHPVILVVAWLLRKRVPLFLFGALWYYGGHSLESTIFPLELFFEHRNYLPSVGIYIAAVAFLWQEGSYKIARSGILVLLVLIAITMCVQRVKIWGDPDWQTKVWAIEHPESMRAQTAYNEYLTRNKKYQSAFEHLLWMKTHWPHAIHVDLLMFNQQCLGNINARLTLSQIAMAPGQSEYHGELLSVLEETMSLYRNQRCPEANAQGMHILLDRINTITKARAAVKARANFMNMQVYSDQGDFSGAVKAMEKTVMYQPTSYTYYNQALLYYSAGLHSEAMLSIDKALQKEENLPFYKRQNKKIVLALKRKIQQAMGHDGI